MIIIPAIDLYDGKCVRLKQGKFDDVTEYVLDPITCASDYAKQGATELHIVDLNGARDGQCSQIETILKVKTISDLTVQMGGGLRSELSIRNLLDKGMDRIVLGSLAVKQPLLVKKLIGEFGVERFVIAFDIKFDKEPIVAINGWRESSNISLWDILREYRKFTGLRILITDISRDGMLSGPNLELYKIAMERYPNFFYQASGGVSCLADLVDLNQIGVSSAIVGKALYEQRFKLKEAISEVNAC